MVFYSDYVFYSRQTENIKKLLHSFILHHFLMLLRDRIPTDPLHVVSPACVFGVETHVGSNNFDQILKQSGDEVLESGLDG